MPQQRASKTLRRASCRVRRARVCRIPVLLAAVCFFSRPAVAVELFDGRIQIHGFYEMQTRVLAEEFDTVDGYNLAQWWHIANVEVEWDAAPEGFGPFDLVSGFLRVEARYDCVWTGGCYTVPSYRDRYGDDASRLPNRLSSGRVYAPIGAIEPVLLASVDDLDGNGDGVPDGVPNSGCTQIGDERFCDFRDTRRRIQLDLGERSRPYGAPAGLGQGRTRRYHLGRNWNLPLLGQFFYPSRGPDAVWGTADDPGFYTLERFDDYRWGIKDVPGNIGGRYAQILGPWRPKDEVPKAGALRDRANPFRGPCPVDPGSGEPIDDPAVCDLRPPRGEPGEPGSLGALSAADPLPFRPAPEVAFEHDAVPDAGLATAQGLYVPNAGVKRLLRKNDLRLLPDLNFSESALALNHGASQGPWNELKEAYLDLEMFDHRLWMRIGRQTIVWGKTELFRAQDQFNPQDVGLASLPSLEESRVPLWSARGVWSFYDVGPVTDVRVEAAINWDEFKPLDTGRCGEPFAPREACTRSFGFFGNAVLGTGLAGELRPGYPWESEDALEGGVRLEFRSDRFSYALSYWNGRADTPYTKPVFTFERNVDPRTGRPRVEGSREPCDPDDGLDAGCLGTLVEQPAPPALGRRLFVASPLAVDPDDPSSLLDEALERHHANLQLFTTLCGATVTFTTLLPEGCGFNVWNSVAPSTTEGPLAVVAPTLSGAFSGILSGRGPGSAGILNSKTLLFTLGRFSEVEDACVDASGARVTCGASAAADLPLVGLTPTSPPPPSTPPGFPLDYTGAGGPPDPANDPDDALFCERLDARLAADDPRRVGSGASFDCAATSNATNYGFWRPIGLARHLTDAQEAIIGCGRFWGSDCDVDGFDIFDTEGSAFYQSWPGIEGTEGGVWDTYGLVGRAIPSGRSAYLQPGTFDAATGEAFDQGPVCSRFVNGLTVTIPGCQGGNARAPGYGDVFTPSQDIGNPQQLFGAPELEAGHPFTGDPWQSEIAALSWNALVTFVVNSVVPEVDDDGTVRLDDGSDFDCDAAGECQANNGLNDAFEVQGLPGRFDQFNPREPFALDRCSFRNPVVCSSVASLLTVGATQSKRVRAGGDGRFGRRDFVWHGGAQAVLDYNRRSITGFAMDFAEDRTGANFNVEFSWFHRVRFSDNGSTGLSSASDTLNLVVSVDRPTFIRFLNRNRTFFFNAQIFVEGIVGWRDSYVSNGPVNALFTFSAFTGYRQDRLIPGAQVVYDVNSESGAFLYSLGYRITQSFLVQFGVNYFFGRAQRVQSPIVPIGTTGIGVGRGRRAQSVFVDNGLSTVRDRDEIFLRLRWAF